ncbi:sigma factor [Streptomyces murinus]|uniref:sigma factor n=1 Tax=Streptomyces murinus TaxID=33900 RepID=UPI003990D2CC|nr:RNA polymerase subunit sigma [Streptomyces murinus]
MKELAHISTNPSAKPDLQRLLHAVALGDQEAFAAVYDTVAGSVLGVARAVLRDQAQSEEVAQDVLMEVWRTAPRYRPERGSALNWILTLAHRRAVDRVWSVEAAARDTKAALLDISPPPPVVAEADALSEESDLPESLPLPEQAVRIRGRAAAAARSAVVRRIRVFIIFSC